MPTRDKKMIYFLVMVLLLFGSGLKVSIALAQEEKGIDFFEAKIRPVLIEQCYRCHNSSDAAEGEFILDHRDAFLKGGKSGKSLIPGDAAGSRLLAILRHEISGLEMPEDGDRLSDAVIADFKKWIELGAPDPRDNPPDSTEMEQLTSWEGVLEQRRKEAWSFQPITKPEVPKVDEPRWSKHPVDRFTYKAMVENGLNPVERAEAWVLIRRLYYVLIGLPPTPEELDQWSIELNKDGGYERLVDSLLERPEFGERWARHWMDWIRYADSYGSEGDPGIENAWHYRDYLIRAVNNDIGFDQLVREHIAGDLLPNPRINHELQFNESMIGPAHLRMVFHGFSPTDALDEKVRFIDDQINAVSKAFLGITLSCARCHHHKFDPISQEDYYAVFGMFASCRPGRHSINVDPQESQLRNDLELLKEEIKNGISKVWISHLKNLRQEWKNHPDSLMSITQPTDARFPLAAILKSSQQTDLKAAIESQITAHEKHDESIKLYAADKKLVQWNLGRSEDGAKWFFEGEGLRKQVQPAGTFAVSLAGDRALVGIYPAGVYSHSVTDKDPARLTSDDFKLEGKYQLWLRVLGSGNSQTRFVVQDYPRNGTVFPTAGIGAPWHWQKFDLTYWDGDEIHVELVTGRDAPVLVNNADRSWFGVTDVMVVPADLPGPPESLASQAPFMNRLRQEKPTDAGSLIDSYCDQLESTIHRWLAGNCSSEEAEWLGAAIEQGILPNQLDSLGDVRSLVQKYREIEGRIVVPTRVPGLDESKPRDQELFVRGNHKEPGKIVPRRFLQAVSDEPYDNKHSGRLNFANDLLRKDNPLTYRVIVNRLWHHLFGRGIVLTADNFGKLGSPPSHPQLLDYLAVEFRERDGSIKQMLRFLVTSQTWQLSARPSAEASLKDPENKYLSHANLRRLEAEPIRDSLLALSGMLKNDRFGPPVDGNQERRSIYVRVQRNSLDPFLRAFDFPEPFSAVGRRDVTNVPAQSLAFMNDPLVSKWAAAWTDRVLSDPRYSSDEARLSQMFRAATGRRPDTAQISRLKMFLAETEQAIKKQASSVRGKQEQVAELSRLIAGAIEPKRQKLISEMLSGVPISQKEGLLQPISRWEFDGTLKDSVGELHLSLHDGAVIKEDHLDLTTGGYALSMPLKKELKGKTLEAWVQLDDLSQRGGGVMTLQSRDGTFFDAIVFGEQNPKQWMAGSNGFERTRSFSGAEEVDVEQAIHVAISYHPDGKIVGFRNGKPYGSEYLSNGPRTYPAEETIVGFGVRHLPAGGNRMLRGRIHRAQLYDRPLSAEEVEASYLGFPVAVTMATVLSALDEKERSQVQKWIAEKAMLEQELASLGKVPLEASKSVVWSEMARAFFSLAEFQFLQ